MKKFYFNIITPYKCFPFSLSPLTPPALYFIDFSRMAQYAPVLSRLNTIPPSPSSPSSTLGPTSEYLSSSRET